MISLCIKYTGLKFCYTFETNDFVFIPIRKDNYEDVEEIFQVQKDKEAEFYVLLKEEIPSEIDIEHFSEDIFCKFKILEALLTLIFSRNLNRDYIFILEGSYPTYSVKKLFKNMFKEDLELPISLLWKDSIVIKFLQEIINTAFETFVSVRNKPDFALRYYFCIDMYFRGQIEKNPFRYISDLWMSLEVLSAITISYILHSHESFKISKKRFFKKLEHRVYLYCVRLKKNKIDCWDKMKPNFTSYMKHKINNFLPIFQKCLEFTGEYVDVKNIKRKLFTRSEFKTSKEYHAYLKNVKEFKEYQDKLTIKKVINSFYKFRNQLFHEGKFSSDWTLDSDRIKANFIKILEQLFFKILGLEMINFYQKGYPYQKIFGIPNQVDLETLDHSISNYIHNEYILPYITDFRKYQFNDRQIAQNHYIDVPHELDPLKSQLKSPLEKILDFLNGNYQVELVNRKKPQKKYTHDIDFSTITKDIFEVRLNFSSGLFEAIANRVQLLIENQNINGIKVRFTGMFDDDLMRYMPTIVPLNINPKYIEFEFD